MNAAPVQPVQRMHFLDVLRGFAITGVLLAFLVTFLYKASDRVIAITIVVTFLVQIAIYDLARMLHLSFPDRPAVTGNYWVENFGWVKYWYAIAIFNWETTLIFLLIGFLAGRKFIQGKKQLSVSQLISIIICGLALGSASYYITTTYSNEIGDIRDIGNTFLIRRSVYMSLMLIHRVSMAAAYAAIFCLLLTRFRLRALAMLGRTSLTNYIMQAVIIVLLCLVLNLFDHITPTLALIITVSLWLLQVLFSTCWLR